MQTKTVNKFINVMEQIGVKTVYLQGDNSNFYQNGDDVDGNCIIFDDENEMAWGVRVNDNYPMSQYRVTGFEYDTIQYLTMEMNREKLLEFLDYMGVDSSIKEKFPKSKYDKGRMNHIIRK